VTCDEVGSILTRQIFTTMNSKPKKLNKNFDKNIQKFVDEHVELSDFCDRDAAIAYFSEMAKLMTTDAEKAVNLRFNHMKSSTQMGQVHVLSVSTEKQFICAILKKGKGKYRDVFSFNTHTQSNVENAMMLMHYGSSDYTLCHQEDIDANNEKYKKKESKVFYCQTPVKMKFWGKNNKYGYPEWAMKSFEIKH
jgi:hypothetical protein